MSPIYKNLNPEKALIWRITHIDNLSWILENGLHCANSSILANNFRQIGQPDLIQKRSSRVVPIFPFGTLSDYIPFYFTPFSPMFFNIFTGKGIEQLPNDEIIILVSSLPYLKEKNIEFLFTDKHAYLELANYYNSLNDLKYLDWELWQKRNFQRDQEDPEKMDRYQAEALVHRYLPMTHLKGIVCYSIELQSKIEGLIKSKGLEIKVASKPEWYFK